MTRIPVGAIVPLLFASVASTASWVNFESSQTAPLRLSADGTRLFAADTADGRMAVFRVFPSGALLRMSEIPVGIEPVSVNPRTNDEVWVVNQVSDTVSVVSVSRRIVIDTLHVGDEPADVVFAAGRAFVSVSRENRIQVYNATTRKKVGSIPVFGENPRALAVNPNGNRVYAAFALSGNRTTLIPAEDAPPPPPPTNPALPPAPQASLIVDAADPVWNPSHVKFQMPDNDVVEIDASSLTIVRYHASVGTVNLGLAVQPGTGNLWVTNTDARNLVTFEPALRGHWIDNRVTRVAVATGAVTPFDLNPTIDYNILPNPPARAIALSQPTAAVFEPGGGALWVASFGTDRVARVDTAGVVQTRIEIGPATGSTVDPRTKRGPRGLAFHAPSNQLYVLNRLSGTLSTVDISQGAVVKEIPVGTYDPTPARVREGRGFLYDAKLSGNGTGACASCHVDGDMDLLAWDLGDPDGDMLTVTSPATGNHDMHPMKGPMTTQTLRGLKAHEPFHWRGDKADFLEFNPAFDGLMGGTEIADVDMEAYRDYIETLAFMPNPYRRLDDSLPPTLDGADPVAGLFTYENEVFTGQVKCGSCHTAEPGSGSNNIIFSAAALQTFQPFKTPQLRNIYQKLSYDPTPGGQSIGGFGITNDGTDPDLFTFLSRPVFGTFANDTVRKSNLAAYVKAFSTGMPPAVGHGHTMDPGRVNDLAILADWSVLEAQVQAGKIDLIAKGTIDGKPRGLLYRPVFNDYFVDRNGIGPFTRAELRQKIQSGDTLTIMGVPRGSGIRLGIDRDEDGVWDGQEFNPRPPIPEDASGSPPVPAE